MSDLYQLDATMLLCPMPVIRTQQRVESLNAGDRLEVTCTDPGAKHDIPAWCRVNGHELVEVIDHEDNFVVVVRVGLDA